MADCYAEYDLPPLEIEALLRDVVGEGGWQNFLRRLQASLAGTTLRVTQLDFEWVVRNYLLFIDEKAEWRNGGWQQRVPKQLREDAVDFATAA